ncbi:MAG TPA: transglutaminase-like domain-containing protein [Acidimicrobiia bacterium]|nr:transglutaminase-like domain-containing protein [Acidimicrobiia bacterium]
MTSSGIAARVRRLPQLAAADRLAECCLVLGTFVQPELDGFEYLGRLDRLAAQVVGSTHLALRRVISIQEGIGGNSEDYNNTDNAFLHRVLDTRRGLPITLSVIWIEVGRRAGLEMHGVGLPGHFLVYAAGQLVDPFHFGEAIGADEAGMLVADALGGRPRLEPAWLDPVDSTAIIKRILGNLDSIYTDAGDERNLEWVRACREVF